MMYALHDSDDNLKRKGAFPITKAEALELNQQGYGIHWTPNTYVGSRSNKNVDKIRFWFVDIDDGSKREATNRLLTAPIKPSVIVETKNGLHAYWKATDGSVSNFRNIQLGLIERFGGDPACKDAARMLRMPGYHHMKDPAAPFLVTTVHNTDKAYKEGMMLFCYGERKTTTSKPKFDRSNGEDLLDETKWDTIFNLNQVCDGGRNSEMSRIAFWLRDAGHSLDVTLNTLRRMNEKITQPLEDREIQQIVRSKCR